jgi:hypothetical protein
MNGFRVAPPFEARSHVVIFVAALLLALSLPLLNHAIFRTNAADVLRAVPPRYENYSFMGDAIARGGDVDILIVGGSDAQTAFDVGVLTEEVSKILGRPVRILNFGANWYAAEAYFVRIRYALSNLKVRVAIVLDTVGGPAPHPLAKYWWLYPDEDIPSSLQSGKRAALYAASVLGAPRQLWAKLRGVAHLSIAPPWRDTASELERTSGFHAIALGWANGNSSSARAPYVEGTLPWREIPPAQMFYRNGSGDAFKAGYGDKPGYGEYSAYETAFLKQADAIVRAQGGTFAMASNLALVDGKRSDKAGFRPLWRNEQRPWPQIGIPTATLFAGLNDEETHAFYYDEDHVNRSGAKHYSRAIAPALAELLANNENR